MAHHLKLPDTKTQRALGVGPMDTLKIVLCICGVAALSDF